MELTIAGIIVAAAAISITSFFVGLMWGKESVYKAYRKYNSYSVDEF
jgi:hypothetical protein